MLTISGVLGVLFVSLEVDLSCLGTLWSALWGPGVLLGRLGALLGHSWGAIEASWGSLGAFGRALEAS